MKNAEGLLLHPSLQKKLLERQTDKKRSVHNQHWIRIDEMLEAVREVVSQIQAEAKTSEEISDHLDEVFDPRSKHPSVFCDYKWVPLSTVKKALLEGSEGNKQ